MRIFKEDKISVIITMLILFLFVLSSLLFSQTHLRQLSYLKIGDSLKGRPIRFIKNNHLVYTANLLDGLKIVDVSDSSNPQLRGKLDYEGDARSLVQNGNLLYVADYIKGLQIFDISNPDNPLLISSLQILNASDIDFSGNKIFVLNNFDELFVIDSKNITKLKIEFETKLTDNTQSNNGYYNYLKCVDDKVWIKLSSNSLTAYKYTDSTFAKLYEYTGIYSHYYPQELKYQEPYLFMTSMNIIQVFNPETFEVINEGFGTNLSTSTGAIAFDKSNDVLYVLQIHFDNFGLVSYDFRDPEDPYHVGEYYCLSPGIEQLAEELIFEDGLLYVLTQDGIKIFIAETSVNVTEENVIMYTLTQNYPNPFNPATTITYSLPEFSAVQLKVYDIIGREVATLVDEQKPAGEYTVNFNAAHLPSGIYIYKLNAGNFSQSRKLVILK